MPTSASERGEVPEVTPAERPKPIGRIRGRRRGSPALAGPGPTLPPAGAGPDPSTTAWSRAQQYIDRLFDALDALDEAGGLSRAAEVGGWRPSRLENALGSIEAARDALDDQLAGLGRRRRR